MPAGGARRQNLDAPLVSHCYTEGTDEPHSPVGLADRSRCGRGLDRLRIARSLCQEARS